MIAILKRYAEVDKAVSGKADLPMLSVLQSIREHIATLVFPGFIGQTPPESLKSVERYLHADLMRLAKAKNDKNRDVRWAWEADEAKQLVDKALAKAKAEPAGPRHEELMRKAVNARWMLEEFYVSLWAQELGTPKPASLNRIKNTCNSPQTPAKAVPATRPTPGRPAQPSIRATPSPTPHPIQPHPPI